MVKEGDEVEKQLMFVFFGGNREKGFRGSTDSEGDCLRKELCVTAE